MTTYPDGGGPFRARDEHAPQYLCPLCYRSASVLAAGVCRRCNVPRVPLDNPQVRDDVRAHAQKILQRRQNREWVAVFGVSVALTLVAYYVGWRLGPLRGEFGIANGSYHIGLVPAAIAVTILFLVALVYFTVFRKRSATVVVAEREAESAQGDSASPRGSGIDPDNLRFAELLRWLGVTIDEQ